MPVGFVEPVNQAFVFLISVFLGATKFPFHASQKNMTWNHWMLNYETFFANLHLYHFLPSSGLAKCFKWGISHVLCLLFQLFLSVLQYQLHLIADSNQVVLYLFPCDCVLFRMLYPLLSILIYIFSLTNCIGHELTLEWL